MKTPIARPSDMPKIERLLLCMRMLIDNEEHMRYTIDDIAERINTSPRTIYRYIRTLNKVGFIIPRPVHGIFHIAKNSTALEQMSKTIYFTDDERAILLNAIADLPENAATKRVKQKLERGIDSSSDDIQEPIVSNNITTLQAAIVGHLQVVLHDYLSGHSTSTQDRIIEPYQISADADYVLAYEPSSKQNKLFKIARIGSITLCELEWQYADKHRQLKYDIFNFAGDLKYPLRLVLTAYAADILMREYPMSQNYITASNDGTYTLDTLVCEYTAPTRFVIGLLDHITIVDCELFTDFLIKKIEQINNVARGWRN